MEVTNETLTITRYDPSQRPQVLNIKPELTAANAAQKSTVDNDDTEGANSATATSQGVKEDEPIRTEDTGIAVLKTKTSDIKAPVVEHPSGVIHYLLTELLTYKDVEDKDPSAASKKPEAETLATDHFKVQTNGTVASSPGTSTSAGSSESQDMKKSEKSEFKPEQHPIYIFRCFILQCLTELLQSYNRSKIEFINFSRKADPKAMTPSKPRSGVLNYLLNDVIPVDTLNHEETVPYRKKTNTSNWAMSAIVSLCLKTNESGYEKKISAVDEDDQADLLFVRKFVLEHALKAYKDANASDEYPDIKYARLLDIADLFQRLLMGRLIAAGGSMTPGVEVGYQKSIAKLMFEKNFISALTSSIADIDLNFPGSKRAIKYILRPLKQLTSAAVALSESSSISTTPGQTTDEDEISTATSVSEAGDEREETPDLFRNSTLGMFEPGREEESSSESSEGDNEMYEDEYDEGIEYEDDIPRDGDEVISDSEDEMGDAGHMEGLHGDPGVNVEVVIDDGDDDADDSEEDPDDSEDMDTDDVEVLDEVSGDDNGSMAEGEDEEWQDEMEDGEGPIEDFGMEQDLSQDQDAESAVRDIVREFGASEAALQRLEGLGDGHTDLAMDIENGTYMDDVVRHDEDEDGM